MKSSPTSATGLWTLLPDCSSSGRILLVFDPFLIDFVISPCDFRALFFNSLMELRVFSAYEEAARLARFLRLRRPSFAVALSNDILEDRQLR